MIPCCRHRLAFPVGAQLNVDPHISASLLFFAFHTWSCMKTNFRYLRDSLIATVGSCLVNKYTSSDPWSRRKRQGLSLGGICNPKRLNFWVKQMLHCMVLRSVCFFFTSIWCSKLQTWHENGTKCVYRGADCEREVGLADGGAHFVTELLCV